MEIAIRWKRFALFFVWMVVMVWLIGLSFAEQQQQLLIQQAPNGELALERKQKGQFSSHLPRTNRSKTLRDDDDNYDDKNHFVQNNNNNNNSAIYDGKTTILSNTTTSCSLGPFLGWDYAWNTAHASSLSKRLSLLQSRRPAFLLQRRSQSHGQYPSESMRTSRTTAAATAVHRPVNVMTPLLVMFIMPWLQLLRRVIRSLVEDWNFKGFGWALYKSVLVRDACGIALRIPLSLNFASWDRKSAVLPYFSGSVGVYYPWMTAFTLTCSLNMQVLQTQLWIMANQIRLGSIFLLATILRTVFICTSSLLFPFARSWIVPEWKSRQQPTLSNEQPYSKKSSPSTASVTTTARSTGRTSEQRIGISWSWRFSMLKGYEFRISYTHMYLQTILYVVEHFLAPRIGPWMRRMILSELLLQPTKPKAPIIPSAGTTPTRFGIFCDSLRRRTAAFGLSTSYPIHDFSKCSCSAMLSLSGFRLIKSRRQHQQQPTLQHSHSASLLATTTDSPTMAESVIVSNDNRFRASAEESNELDSTSYEPALTADRRFPIDNAILEGDESTSSINSNLLKARAMLSKSSSGSKVTS